jgi:hypothetical protein
MAVYIRQHVVKGQNQMMTDEKFSHRFNADGTVDSICRECFATVATVGSETELLAKEHLHSCNPQIVEWYHRPTRPSHMNVA